MKPRLSKPEQGIALVIALIGLTVMLALGAAVVLLTSTDTIIAGNFRHSRQALYAAEAIAELALADLRTIANWTDVVEGRQRSRFVDGPPDGVRDLPIGSPVDVGTVLNLANCDAPTPCAGAPRWQLFAHGPLRDLLSMSGLQSPFYVVAFVRAASLTADGIVVIVRGEAFGPRGAHSTIDLTVSKLASEPPRIVKTVFE